MRSTRVTRVGARWRSSAAGSSDVVLGAPLTGGAGCRAAVTGGAKVCHPSGLVAEMGVDTVFIGFGLGGESPIVIGRCGVIRLRY